MFRTGGPKSPMVGMTVEYWETQTNFASGPRLLIMPPFRYFTLFSSDNTYQEIEDNMREGDQQKKTKMGFAAGPQRGFPAVSANRSGDSQRKW